MKVPTTSTQHALPIVFLRFLTIRQTLLACVSTVALHTSNSTFLATGQPLLLPIPFLPRYNVFPRRVTPRDKISFYDSHVEEIRHPRNQNQPQICIWFGFREEKQGRPQAIRKM
eukprot:c30474_g1_i1 orf=1-339(-)